MIGWYTAVLISLVQYQLCAGQGCPDSGSNAVEMKFYRAQRSEFVSENGEINTVVEIIARANSYCPNENTQCDLISCCNDFKTDEVFTVSGYPKDDSRDMLHKIYLVQPDNSTCAVRKRFVQEIIERAREDIHDATGYWITYIDNDFYGIPPPTRLNQIIIPIAFGVLLILVILTVVLYKLHQRREAQERRERIIRERKMKTKKSQVEPAYNVDISKPVAGHKISAPTTDKPKRKDQMYKTKLRESTVTKKMTASIASEDSAIKIDADTTRHRQGYNFDNSATGYNEERGPYNHLEPIEMTETDTVEKKKKKKKKKSKSREAVLTNDGYTESYEDTM